MFYLEINNCFLLLILAKMMTLNSPDGNENPAALRLEMLQIEMYSRNRACCNALAISS